MNLMLQHPARLGAVLLLAFTLLSVGTTRAQEDEDNTWSDTTWDDLGLDPEGFKYDEEVLGQVSAGWFPKAYTGSTLSLSGPLFYQDLFDRARDIRPGGFVPTTSPFTHRNPFDDNEREILQRNSKEEEEDGYPASSLADYSLTYLYNLPMPAILRVNAGLQITQGILFSEDTSRNYLSIGGAKQPLKEVGVAYLKQYSIAGSAGINIPVYGGFIKSEATTFSSYYYLYGGYSFAYAVSSEGTQYSQIANAKDQIRYGNGTDTTTLINARRFEELNRLRTGIEVGVGWNLAVESAAFGVEGFISIPQSSVLKDVEWNQYFVGFRISLGWQWFPKKKKKP